MLDDSITYRVDRTYILNLESCIQGVFGFFVY